MPNTASGIRRAGLISVDLDGELLDVVGDLTYSLGLPILEELPGADRIHGFSEKPGIPFMEFGVRDGSGVDAAELAAKRSATLQAQLANGKTVILHEAAQAGDASTSTESGEISTRWVGLAAEEITT